MADPLGTVSPSRMNREAYSGRHTQGITSPAKPALVSEPRDENQPFDSPSGPPSSPFVADVAPTPVKTFSPSKVRSAKKDGEDYQRVPLTEDALRKTASASKRSRSIDESRIDPSIRSPRIDEDAASTVGYPGMDDTCFSTFSAIPNTDMTRLTHLAQSPTRPGQSSPYRGHAQDENTPRPRSRHSPTKSTSVTRMRREHHATEEDTLNLLMDYSENTIGRSPTKGQRGSPTKSQTAKEISFQFAGQRTPSPSKDRHYGHTAEGKQLANLLDVDLPPAPTPRSVPSITARELESMKSGFMSQISALTATLSGRDAEVKALSQAISDAENRVGTALEEARNERSEKDSLRSQKDDLERRQNEMQSVLKDVKQEIIAGDREKDVLLQRMQEAEHKREEVEARLIEAESKIDSMKQTTASAGPTPENGNTNAQVEAAVTKVAQELHTLYKNKHETKVTALKKSYSDRWEKKVKTLTSRVEELTKENEDLRTGRDTTMSGVVPGTLISGNAGESQQAAKETEQRLQRTEKDLTEAHKSLSEAKAENTTLQAQLSASRTEIDELVAATEELMQLSHSALGSSTSGHESSSQTTSAASTSQEIKSSLSRSLSGSSGLKPPGFGATAAAGSGESRIGRIGMAYASSHSRERSGSGLGSRSGIMSNIERMGRGRNPE